MPAEKLRRWYLRDDALGVPGEHVVDGDLIATDTALVGELARHIGPVTPAAVREGARFL